MFLPPPFANGLAMGTQLALFAGIVAAEPPVLIEPPSLEVPDTPSPRQMGLFDEHARRLRAALDAVGRADLAPAVSLLRGLSPDFDPIVPELLRRAAEVQSELARLPGLPPNARAQVRLELGRALAADRDPWSRLGRALIGQAAAELGPTDGVHAGRLFLEAGDPGRARTALAAVPGPASAPALFALGDVESALADRAAARRHYLDALVLNPFDSLFEQIADAEVRELPYLAEYEVEVDGDPRAWCAPVGIVAGILPRPFETCRELPVPAGMSAESAVLLGKARDFVDGLVRVASADVQRSRDSVLESRRIMKSASASLFAWYMARQVGAR